MAGMDISSLFASSVNNNSYNSMNFGIDLGDYAAIQNGSYFKVAKANYAKQKAADLKEEKPTDSKQALSTMKANGDALKTAAEKLTSKSLWEMKPVKSKDETTGETTEKLDYDRAAINSAIQSFVSAYNDMIDSAGNSQTKSVLRNATGMINDTKSVSKLLDQVGIKIGSDNKLSVDEDKLKDASMGTLKTLFEGYGSFGDKILSKANAISRGAKEATDTYTGDGKYTNGAAGASSTAGTTNKKATYQLSDEMQKAILEQVKLDYYMYGGKTEGKSDSANFTKKMDSFLKSVSSDKKTDAKDSINKFREELSSLVSKAIKAEDASFKPGNTVDASILNRVFAKDDDLLAKAAQQAYGNSFDLSV